jgi:putative ABC transport system permease protein
MRRFFLRVVNLLRSRRAESEMSREITAHLALLQEDFERNGMSTREAMLAARRTYGGVEQSKELHREARSFVWIEQLIKDVRYSARNLRRSPGFTITAVAAIALGIGATTAIFSIVNSVLLKPLHVPDPDRLVVLSMASGSESGDGDSASPAKFMHWRAQTSVIQDVSAFLYGFINYTGGEVMEQWRFTRMSADTFRCFGIQILQGRSFTPEEDLPNGPAVAVISQGLWKRRFASDPQILGKAISLNGEPHTVIGIAGDTSAMREYGPAFEVYVPFQIDPNTNDQGDLFDVVARLKPGVTLIQAQARLQASAADYRVKFPNELGPKDGFTAKPYRENLVADVRPLLLILLGAVGLVLLIACANVASLLLVRAAGRKREIAIRAAIGAGRGRVIRQLLVESVLLSFAGGALGMVLGYGGIRALLAVNTAGLPMVGKGGAEVNVDWRVVGFTLAVSLVTGIIFGLFPALQSSHADLNSVLKDSSGRWGTGLQHNQARAVLVIAEVSLAVVLLVGAALLIRSFKALYAADLGFETKNVVTMGVLLAGPKYSRSADVADTVRSGLERLRALPGVVAAGTTCCLPLAQGNYSLNFDIAGRPPATLSSSQDVGWATVSPGYFEVFKIPVKRGRTFTDQDDSKSPAVVVINERMAQQYWKDTDPLGERIVIGQETGINQFKDEPVRQIIGIVGDVRDEALDSKPHAVMYVPQAQLPDAVNQLFFPLLPMEWLVRTRGQPQALLASIQEQLRQATGLPVPENDIGSMDQVVWAQTGRQRFNMLLMTVFGCAALLLAAIGIYGLMAYTVEQRTQEIGIRLALGAEATQLRNMVIRQGMNVALAGVVIGLGAAWVVSRLMESLLFGVKPRDPIVFVTVPLALGAVALLAVWLPAKRALRVDPAVALRHE